MNRDEEAVPEVHARARRLISAARVEGIPAADREWLDAHLETCARCAGEAAAVAAAIDALRAAPMLADAAMVRRTRIAVRRRAEEVHLHDLRAAPLWMAGALSVASMIVTIPCSWWTFAWLGRTAGVSEPVWQGALLICWFLPATIVTGLIAWRHAGEGTHRSDWTAQLNRGHV
jgi:hypothetical protein